MVYRFSNKIRDSIITAGLFLLFAFSGCINDLINDRMKHERMQKICDTTTVVKHWAFYLKGYDYDQVDTVWVMEISQYPQPDTSSFPVYPVISNPEGDKKNSIASIDKEINIHDEFLIIIAGEREHKLKNITMGLMELNAIGSTDYFCTIYSHELDGKTHSNCGIEIYK